MPRLARHRHRRLDPRACVLLRRGRNQADLQPRQPLRRDRVRVLTRPGWTVYEVCARRRNTSAHACSARDVPNYEKALTGDVKGLRIGVPKEYFVEGMQPEVERSVREAIKSYESLGATTVEVSLPHSSYAVAAYYLVATAEASANLARYDGIRYGLRVKAEEHIDLYNQTRAEGFGAEVKRRIMLGTFALSAGYYDAYYLKGQKVRTLIRRDFEQAFEKCDLIVTPVAPTTAFQLGEKMNDPLTMYLSDIFTISVNLAGLPGMSMPCGYDEKNLPIGVQLIGPLFSEEVILRAGDALERTGNFAARASAV